MYKDYKYLKIEEKRVGPFWQWLVQQSNEYEHHHIHQNYNNV